MATIQFDEMTYEYVYYAKGPLGEIIRHEVPDDLVRKIRDGMLSKGEAELALDAAQGA